MSRAYSSREVAEIIGADPSSVNRWIDAGEMNAYRTPGGHRRVLVQDLVSFLQRCGMPIPSELQPQHLNVLLVDDDKVVLKSLQRALQRTSTRVQVECSTSGIEALIQIGKSQPDVVVLDVYMPGLDGVEVCKKLKGNDETAGIRVVAVSGQLTPKLEKRLLDAGADRILSKPLRAAALLKAIESEDTLRASASV